MEQFSEVALYPRIKPVSLLSISQSVKYLHSSP